MPVRWFGGILSIGLTLFMASASKADDGYVTGIGGAVRLMHGHPTIRMVSEEVHIQLPEGRVSARFTFRNDGPATTVEIGFPETGDRPPLTHTDMAGFRSTVDGQSLRVTRRVALKPTDEDDPYAYWWVKKVAFARGQTRIIVNTYTGGINITSPYAPPQPTGFMYVLKTGASWHGPIGRARIVCDLGSVAEDGPIWFHPASGKREGRTITWDLQNFKPREDVEVNWYPGFSDISVNGHWLWKPFRGYGGLCLESVYDSPYVSFKRGTVIWVPVRFAALWLNALLKREATEGVVSLTRNGRKILFTVGRTSLTTERGSTTLPDRVFKRDGAIYIPLQTLVEAFDGEAHFNPSGRLLIALPEPPAKKP